MTDRDDNLRRWAELMDRSALGEALSAEERAFCERVTMEDRACRREVQLLDELARLDAAPDAESGALVDATLARLVEESAKAEREELSQLKRPSRAPWVMWISGAAAVAAVAAAIVLLPARKGADKQATATVQPPNPRVELVYAAGDVLVDGKPVTFGSTLLTEGSEITVKRGSACFAMDPDIDVCTGEYTRLSLARMHSPWRRVDLLEGKVGVQLSPQPDGFRLSIVADGVWATAVGTAFTVERGKASSVRTTVLHGKVRVGSDDGKEELVSEHQRAEVRGERATVAPIGRSDESPEWALLGPAKLWSNPVSATLELRGVPAGSEVLLDGQAIGVAPLSSLIPAGMHRLQIRIDGRIAASREFVSEVGQLTAISFEGQLLDADPEPVVKPSGGASSGTAPALRGGASFARAQRPSVALQPIALQPIALPEPPAETVPAAAEMLHDARRLMRAERFAEAAGRYQALREAYPRSPEAHAVLVSLAELQLDRLHQPAAALDTLERYLREGRGALVEEARQVRIRALRNLGRLGAEADAIAEFLREHPRSFEAAALRQRAAELEASP
jgi:tetratricopeptide (TPR) repeat protein